MVVPALPGKEEAVSKPQRVVGRARTGAPALDMRGRHVRIEPAWRALVQERLEAWTRRHPGVVSLRVTLSRTRHHRQGVEEAAAQMLVAGRALHAVREAETMTTAIR